MFVELIRQAKHLLVRLEAEYAPEADSRPPEERLTHPELEGWYTGVTALLSERFGEESPEFKLWSDGLRRIREHSWNEVGRSEPRGGHWTIDHLLGSIEVLEQLRLLQLRNVASSLSTLSFSSLHPKVVERSEQMFMAHKYDDAILAAFREVEEAVRRRANAPATDYGLALIANVMKSPNPRLRFSNIPQEQEAFHSLFRGAIGAFKNPLSHRTVGHADPVRVLELLAFASLLLRAVDDLSAAH